MKAFLRKHPALFPGYGQLLYDKKVRGWTLTLAFWDCMLVGGLFFLLDHPLGLPIGVLCEVLAGLIWVYNYLDYMDLASNQPLPEVEEEPVKEKKKKKKEIKAKKDIEEETKAFETIEEEEEAEDFYASGRIFFLNGELKSARVDFEKALKSDKDDWDAMYQLGKVHFELGQKKKAKKYFEQYRKTKDSTKWNKEATEYLKQLGKN